MWVALVLKVKYLFTLLSEFSHEWMYKYYLLKFMAEFASNNIEILKIKKNSNMRTMTRLSLRTDGGFSFFLSK